MAKHVFKCSPRYPYLRVVWPTNGTATIRFNNCHFETNDDDLAKHLEGRANIERVQKAAPVEETPATQPEKRGPGRPRKEG